MDSLDKETKELLISLGIDVNEVTYTESIDRASLKTTVDINQTAEYLGEATSNSAHSVKLDQGEAGEESVADPSLSQSDAEDKSDWISKKKKLFSITVSLIILCSLILGFSFLSPLQDSPIVDKKILSFGPMENNRCFFSARTENKGLGNSLSWKEYFLSFERESNEYAFNSDAEAIFHKILRRKSILEAKDQEIESLISQMSAHIDLSYLLLIQKALKRAINAEIHTVASISENAVDLVGKMSEPEKKQLLTELEDSGFSLQSMQEYLQLKEKIEQVQESVNQACDLLSDQGENIIFLAETLDHAMKSLEEIEQVIDSPLHIALCQALDVPAMKKQLINACSESIDLLVQERLSRSQAKKKPFSFQEVKAIATLMNRMTSKGDKNRLQSLEIIEEEAFKRHTVPVVRTTSLMFRPFNALDKNIQADSLTASITFPPEGMLCAPVDMIKDYLSEM